MDDFDVAGDGYDLDGLDPDDCPPPRYARVQQANPSFERGGQHYPGNLEWVEVLYTEPGDCDHQTSMCSQCVEDWLCDHHVELPEGEEFPDGVELEDY